MAFISMKGEFFNVYLCAVCKSKDSFNSSKLCTGCKLVSYCGTEHQKADWQNHKNICKVVRRVCHEQGADDLFAINIPPDIMDDFKKLDDPTPKRLWSVKRNYLSLQLSNRMTQNLKQFELYSLQLFYPKHCAICYSRKIARELVCTDCFSRAYCSAEHQRLDDHKNVCPELKRALDMDLFMQSVDLESPSQIPPMKPNQAINLTLSCDMHSFITNYFGPGLTFEVEALISFFYTNVLTFAYSICKIPNFTLGEKATIHIAGAEECECQVLEYWENLMHLFPRLQALTLIHIGPCIKARPLKLRLCNDCTRASKSVECFFYSQSYDAYCKDSHVTEKPNAIVAFNSGLHDVFNDKWGNSLQFFLQYSNVPFIFTACKKSEADKDLKRMLNEDLVGNKKVTVVVGCEKNVFPNLRPWTCWESVDGAAVRVKNSYISVLVVESG